MSKIKQEMAKDIGNWSYQKSLIYVQPLKGW